MEERVEKFLKSKNFDKGDPLSDNEIELILKGIGRNASCKDFDEEYKNFLNQYGAIHGDGLYLSASTIFQKYTPMQKINLLIGRQLGFVSICEEIGMRKKVLGSCWLVARDKHNNRYYMKLGLKKCIYSLDTHQTSRRYAKNFLEFLDKMFDACEVNKHYDSAESENEDSDWDDEDSESEEDED